MPFITAGDPDLATTQALIRELAARGVDLIEVGFPYSDPIADGPVIQASYTRALGKKLRTADLFAAIREVTTGSDKLPPLVAMVSYALIFRQGISSFLKEARDSGFSGLIVPDLPAEEGCDLARQAQQAGLDLVQLIAPTTTTQRTGQIVDLAQGFIYCISVAGTTGERTQLPLELQQQLKDLKARSRVPLAVGFGVSRPEQVDQLRGLADGVIVGSAIVRQVARITTENIPAAEALKEIGDFAAQFVAATHHS